jgi:uncharacterized protein (DUF4213/DUF364 family)
VGILDELFDVCYDGKLINVSIGIHWTSVMAKVEGELRCGLSSTVVETHKHTGKDDVPEAGRLEEIPSKNLAKYIKSDTLLLRSIGMATINALLPRFPKSWSDKNADEVIIEKGKGKKVVIIGNFPFIPHIKEIAGTLDVLELMPIRGERPASDAPDVIPQADVVAITGMTLVNYTFDDLLKLCSPKATVLVLGPSTPLHPIMFDHGIELLSGSIVQKIEPVNRMIMQGACFRQIHHAGVRLVTMSKPK